ncbi:unnamed protein product [Durusdinium trenchii]|uniref:Uncharacterized protein n=1 Tax=Durusdinium trenchii TaxID=1381693 RepID=A0ABP0P1Z9_9DINO
MGAESSTHATAEKRTGPPSGPNERDTGTKFCCCRGEEADKEISHGAIIREALEETEVPGDFLSFKDPTAYSRSFSSCQSLSDLLEDGLPIMQVPNGKGSWHEEGGSYKSCKLLAKSLADGDAVLVWGSWLVKLAQGHPSCNASASAARSVLPRRQNLPAEALCSIDEIRKGTPLLAVSYCWATATHPDPEASQLNLLGQLLDRWLSWRQRRSDPPVNGPGACQDAQNQGISENLPMSLAPQSELHGEMRSDVAVLVDWCSTYQEPRFAAERRSSERFLQQVGRWFAHEHTTVWLLTKSPLGAEPYSMRGWPTFERAVSLLPIGSKEVLDIGQLQNTSLKSDWPSIAAECQAKRLPPLTPAELRDELRQKHFSWSHDRELLGVLYQEVYEDVVERAIEMPLSRMKWGDLEMGQLQGTLGSCSQLQRLDLTRNRIGDSGAETLANILLQSPRVLQSLHLLDLSGNEIGDLGLCSLAAALPSVRSIKALAFDSNFIGDPGAERLAMALPNCSGLQGLILRRNEIGDNGAGELARAMPRCSNLQLLDLSENEVSDVGAERFAAALPKCGQLQRFDLARNRVGDRGALSLAAALPRCHLHAFGLGGHEVGEILGGSRIGDGGAGLLASALLRCERLCKLDLSENQIGDRGTAQLAAAMPHCGQLAELDLYRNRIADNGVGRLAEAVPQCGHLEWLRLLENSYGIKGATRMVEAWEAAGKAKGRLLCRPSPCKSGGYAGWASWGSPSRVVPRQEGDPKPKVRMSL